MVWSAYVDDAKMLLDIPFPMNYVIIDQLAFNLVDMCLDRTLQADRNEIDVAVCRRP